MSNRIENLPHQIESEAQLDELLTTPSEQLVESITSLVSPLVVLGAGGKMGPSLVMLAKRAAEQAGHPLEIVAVSRFQNRDTRNWLTDRGIETRAVDIFDSKQLASLPDSPNVVYLVGLKFGSSKNPIPTWATNTVGPVLASERYAGSRIVALSTGNVYPLSSISSGGSIESDALTPIGEYANAAVARERVFQHYATIKQTAAALVRLNYAHDLRYGVITDIAHKVWHRQPIDLSMGYFNAIWQGDANNLVLRSFSLCAVPARSLNVTGTQLLSVRDVAGQLGALLGREPVFHGQEDATALLSNTATMVQELGEPSVAIDQLVSWIAHWTSINGATLGKPTHYQTRDGKY